MTTYYYRLPGLRFGRPLIFGVARFIPAESLAQELNPALSRAATTASMRAGQERVTETLAHWGDDAALAVSLHDGELSDRAATEAVGVLRFFMRDQIRVNVDVHLIGLVGEIRQGIRDFIVLWDRDKPLTSTCWRRVGGTVNLTFSNEMIAALEGDSAVAFLGKQLSLPLERRSANGARSLTALSMYDTGLRAVEPTLRVLCSAIAVEVLFSDPDDGDRGRTTLIARRVAYLTCQGGCGGSADHCPYSKPGARSLRALFNDLAALADNGQEWRCSAFLDLVAPEDVTHALEFPPLFAARNQIAHEGAMNADKRTMSHLLWVTDRALNVGLSWLADNPDKSWTDLDRELAARAH